MSWDHDASLSEVDLRNYHQLLVDHNLISQSRASQALEDFNSPSTPDYPRCPICSHRLIICHGCLSVTCDYGLCQGADLVKFLFSCPLCFSTLAATDECSELDAAGNCRSRPHFNKYRAISSDRVGPTEGPMVCACGDTCVCGACATQKNFLIQCGRCPRCQVCFCFKRCKYIGVCADCQRTTLCNDCMELEEDDHHLPDKGSSTANLKPPVLLTACERCKDSICADCFVERLFCGRASVFCQYCTEFIRKTSKCKLVDVIGKSQPSEVCSRCASPRTSNSQR